MLIVPGREAEGRPELYAARASRAEGELDELALALRVDAPEAALARLLLAARHFDEVSGNRIDWMNYCVDEKRVPVSDSLVSNVFETSKKRQ